MVDFPTVLFNPKSADAKHRIPISILQVGGILAPVTPYYLVDGNLEDDPLKKLFELIEEKAIRCVGFTVMPGPQLQQAIPFAREIRKRFPHLKMIWGGYFATNQHEVVLHSGWVDVVINGVAEESLPELIQHWANGNEAIPESIPNLIFLKEGKVIKTRHITIPDMEKLPAFPYDTLHASYPLPNYLARTFMGNKTMSYHSSFGCPFTCSFCAVVPIYNARWKGLDPQRIASDVYQMKEQFGIDAVEFFDNNFFTSRNRTVAFAELIKDWKLQWWGEGRIDTIDKYSDDDLRLLKESGLKMIFLGAETGNDEILRQMDKGGTQTGAQILSFAGRLKKIGIIPEYSFVLGLPPNGSQSVDRLIKEDITFIRKVKRINPDTEIILYVYSPVPTEDSDLFRQITEAGFSFPEHLEDWLSPAWERFDLRKNPLTPWLKPKHIRRIKNFETVLHAYYPTCSDFRLSAGKRRILKGLSWWRYRTRFYAAPYELKALLKWWNYRKPEEQGFRAE